MSLIAPSAKDIHSTTGKISHQESSWKQAWDFITKVKQSVKKICSKSGIQGKWLTFFIIHDINTSSDSTKWVFSFSLEVMFPYQVEFIKIVTRNTGEITNLSNDWLAISCISTHFVSRNNNGKIWYNPWLPSFTYQVLLN